MNVARQLTTRRLCTARPFAHSLRRTFYQPANGVKRLHEEGSEAQDEAWKDVVMVDYGTGATSSIPPTSMSMEQPLLADQQAESSDGAVFQHWSTPTLAAASERWEEPTTWRDE